VWSQGARNPNTETGWAAFVIKEDHRLQEYLQKSQLAFSKSQIETLKKSISKFSKIQIEIFLKSQIEIFAGLYAKAKLSQCNDLCIHIYMYMYTYIYMKICI
jgi:hypothetical protein